MEIQVCCFHATVPELGHVCPAWMRLICFSAYTKDGEAVDVLLWTVGVVEIASEKEVKRMRCWQGLLLPRDLKALNF